MQKGKFDSFLYGNGLSIHILNQISEKLNCPMRQYLSFNTFLRDFAIAEPHKRILRDFNSYFEFNNDVVEFHKNARKTLRENIEEICHLGFERWVSKYMFEDEKRVSSLQDYLYFVYNHWYNIIASNILQNKKSKKIIKKVAAELSHKLINSPQIFTTNYDLILDSVFNTSHIHGSLIFPLERIQDVILFHINDKQYEYSYLFGTNGIEKLYRLNIIGKQTQDKYDLSFLFDDELDLGHLLILGLSFGKAEVITKEFLKEYPQYNNFCLARSVDGHILESLKYKYSTGRLNLITISYYSQDDIDNYNDIFAHYEFKKIIRFIDYRKILDLKTISQI